MQSPSTQRRGLIVAMLLAVMVISVLDKTIFAFAGPQIIDELKLTPEQFGFIGSAFFFLYSVSGVLVGFLANRVASRWILCGMSVVWMGAQILTAISTSFYALVASRMLLGAGCGPGTAVTQHAAFKWYAPRDRVLPGAWIHIAIMVGAILGALSLPLLIQHLGWRVGYLILAGVGMLWLVVWLLVGREGQHDDTPGEVASEIVGGTARYRHLLLNRTFIFITLLGFCSYLPNALIYSWVPTYLQKGLGMSPMQAGYVVMAATIGVIALNLLVSSLSQRALKRGASVRLAMVFPPAIACVVGGIAMALMGFVEQGVAMTITLYLIGGIVVNLVTTFSNTTVAYIAPAKQRGSMLALHIGLMTSAGMLAPHVVGQAIGWEGGDLVRGFELAVGLFGIALIAGGALALRLVDPEQDLRAIGKLTRQPSTESNNVPAASQA